MFATTATEAALYDEQTSGLLRRRMVSLTHKNLPLAMFLEVGDLGYPAWGGSKSSAASKIGRHNYWACVACVCKWWATFKPFPKTQAAFGCRIMCRGWTSSPSMRYVLLRSSRNPKSANGPSSAGFRQGMERFFYAAAVAGMPGKSTARSTASLLKSSTMVSTLIRRPLANASLTKSIDHT